MTHHVIVGSAVVTGGLIAMFAGRIYGQMQFEQDEQGKPSIAQSVAVFFGVLAAMVGHHFFGLKGELLFALAVPAYWLTPVVTDFVNSAPELDSDTPSYRRKSEAEIRRENLNFFKGVGLVLSLVAALFACGLIADSYGLLGAILSVMIVAPLCAVPCMGAFFTLIGAVGTICVLVARSFRQVEQLASGPD